MLAVGEEGNNPQGTGGKNYFGVDIVTVRNIIVPLNVSCRRPLFVPDPCHPHRHALAAPSSTASCHCGGQLPGASTGLVS